jgi:hypothetical protein
VVIISAITLTTTNLKDTYHVGKNMALTIEWAELNIPQKKDKIIGSKYFALQRTINDHSKPSY